MNYVIRHVTNGVRTRVYFSSKRKAQEYARANGLPLSQIKVRG